MAERLRLVSPRLMESGDLEGDALCIYAEAGLDPAEPVSAHDLAHALLGRGGVRYARGLLVGAKYQSLPDGREWIFVRPGLPLHVESLKILHEVAERHFARARRVDEDLEVLCDQLAYRLRMPRPLYRELVATVGPDWRELSRPWGASEAASALRYLEVTGTPGVVITPRAARARGEEWAWPDEAELRRLARARHLPAGVERRSMRGGVVLMAV